MEFLLSVEIIIAATMYQLLYLTPLVSTLWLMGQLWPLTVPVNKLLLEPSHIHLFTTHCHRWLHSTMAELSSCNRDYSQSLKYLPSGPSQKNSGDSSLAYFHV